MKKTYVNKKLKVLNDTSFLEEGKKKEDMIGILSPREGPTERMKLTKIIPYNLPPWMPKVQDEWGETRPFEDIRERMPPLMQSKSWTKSLPYKDTFEFWKPSERIGRSYHPSADRLRIRNLPPKRRRSPSPLAPPGEDIDFPPPEYLRKAAIAREKPKLKAKPRIVSLYDLLSGKYYKDKELAKERKEKLKIKKMMEKEKRIQKELEEERKVLKKMSAMLPMDPDDQRKILLENILEKTSRLLDVEIEKKLFII